MKKIMMVAMALIVACSASFAETKDAKELRQERQEIRKMSVKELNKKCTKTAKKEAKRLAKEGWKVTPGSISLKQQLDKTILMQMEYDESNYPKYIMGSAQSIGENYDAAKMAATSLAINDLAGQIQTEVTALIENTVANKQLAPNEAVSISETVMSSKSLISQSIGRTLVVLECYRELENKNKEVLVRVAYDGKAAKEAMKKAIRDELANKGENLQQQLDNALGL